MKLTPAIKGKLTRAVKSLTETKANAQTVFTVFLGIFMQAGNPQEQAKHATRKYIQSHFKVAR